MLKTFSIGGVHPHENKLSAHQPIIKAEVPAKAVILLGQHIGACLLYTSDAADE